MARRKAILQVVHNLHAKTYGAGMGGGLENPPSVVAPLQAD